MKKQYLSAMKSWKTTLIGFASIGVSLYMFLKGSPWESVVTAVGFGVGMVFSKDSNVTHSNSDAQPS